MLLAHRVVEELVEDLRDVQLTDRAEVALGQRRIDGADRQLEVLVAEEVPELAHHLLDPHVGARVARADVAREQELQGLARPPREHRIRLVARPGRLDEAAHPELDHAVRVEAVLGEVEGALGGPPDQSHREAHSAASGSLDGRAGSGA
ncbi:MAG TPA: hypothetical protein DEF51_26130 [Myxococcales bacterium]|nr:hypothetical protein [Myxococcales bacterium]